jgi:uncharacterized protein (DUF2252 family)
MANDEARSSEHEEKSKSQQAAEERVRFRSRADRLAAGNALRERVPRQSHERWSSSRAKSRDPIEILNQSNEGRVQELVPLRFGRMLRSPFTFFRGSAGLMAHDLAKLPGIQVHVQACGDCHLVNFGMFATPERKLVFDINDFDETLPAPWEWDVKRLAASFAVAVRDNGISDAKARDIATACVRSYREHLREYSRMSPLEVWYARMDLDYLIETAPDAAARKRREAYAKAATGRVLDNLFPKISAQVAGRPRLVDQPPVLFHVADEGAEDRVHQVLLMYRESLPDERRVLFDRYRMEDFAMKVVGIGSVGTRCWIVLFFSEENYPLILQFKEACRSVLEPYTGKSVYENQGQRIVNGQRLMQSSSDIFLGWVRSVRGYDYYVRQLRDMKFSIPMEGAPPLQFERYAEICGWVLARAHAKSGDAATISGYLGKSDNFDLAIAKFAVAYADQTERDHAALVKAVRAGRIEVLEEEI